jgi:hypothetical protein
MSVQREPTEDQKHTFCLDEEPSMETPRIECISQVLEIFLTYINIYLITPHSPPAISKKALFSPEDQKNISV